MFMNNKFTIDTEEYIVKSLRLDKSLVDRGQKISHDKNISFNKFVNLALRFALEHFEEAGTADLNLPD